MPIKRIQFPDGSIKRVEVPDGATDEQIIAFVQSQHASRPDFGNVRGKSGPTVPDKPDHPLRGFGMGARNVAEGAAGVLDFFGGPIRYGIEQVTGIPQQTFGGMADKVADTIGLPEARTPMERGVADVNRSLAGVGLTMGAGGLGSKAEGLTGTASRFFSANPAQQTIGATTGAAAGSATRENGGGTGAQIGATLAGGLTPAVLSTLPQAATRLIARGGETGRKVLEAAIDDFRAANTSPTLGQGTQRWIWRGVESLLAKLPGSSGVMERVAAQQGQDIGAGVNSMAQTLSPRIDSTRAGRAIERGINGPDGFMERTGSTVERLYGKLDEHIAPNARVGVENTRAILPELNPTIPGAPSLSKFFQNGRIAGIHRGLEDDVGGVGALMSRPGTQEWVEGMRAAAVAEADNIARQNVLRTSLGQRPLPVPTAAQIDETIAGRLAAQVDERLPYEAVKKTRTLVGKEIADAGIGADVPRSKWNPLYGALSQDMRAAADDAGAAAQQAWSRANNYTRAKAGRQEAIAHVVDKSGGPEAIFNAAISGTRDGATTLTALMRSLPKGAQKDVAAAVLQRMGRATDGNQNAAGDVFSSATFLTNWNKLSPQARGALFDRFGSDFRAQVEAITRVASNLRTGSRVFANPSGTATTGAQIGGYTALGATGMSALMGNPLPLAGTVGALGTTNGLARLVTNPRFVNWLSKETRVPFSAIAAQPATQGSQQRDK